MFKIQSDSPFLPYEIFESKMLSINNDATRKISLQEIIANEIPDGPQTM